MNLRPATMLVQEAFRIYVRVIVQTGQEIAVGRLEIGTARNACRKQDRASARLPWRLKIVPILLYNTAQSG